MSGFIIAVTAILFTSLAIALIGSVMSFPFSAGVALHRKRAGGGLYLHAGAAVRSKGGGR